MSEKQENHHDHAHDHDRGKCMELAERISEYVDAELPLELKLRVEEHVDGCVNCEKFIESVRRTRDLAHLLAPHELSPEDLKRITEEARHRLEG